MSYFFAHLEKLKVRWNAHTFQEQALRIRTLFHLPWGLCEIFSLGNLICCLIHNCKNDDINYINNIDDSNIDNKLQRYGFLVKFQYTCIVVSDLLTCTLMGSNFSNQSIVLMCSSFCLQSYRFVGTLLIVIIPCMQVKPVCYLFCIVLIFMKYFKKSHANQGEITFPLLRMLPRNVYHFGK